MVVRRPIEARLGRRKARQLERNRRAERAGTTPAPTPPTPTPNP